MRSNAIENLLKLMCNAVMDGNQNALNVYVAKARILTDRDSNDASVIKELVNQSVELYK